MKSQPTNTNELEPTTSWFGSIANLNLHPSDLAYETRDYEIFEWIHMNGCPWNEDTDWLQRLNRWRDNRYIWFAEEHKGILKNADLVQRSLAKHRRDERQRMDRTNQIIVGPLVIFGTVMDGAYRTMAFDQEE